MSSSTLYCRFCAEEKCISEFTAKTTHEFQNSVIKKLSIFENIFVDFSIKNMPKTVCIACFELINISVTFFLKVQKAQDALRGIFELKDESDFLNSLSDTMVKEELNYHGEDPQDDELASEACSLKSNEGSFEVSKECQIKTEFDDDNEGTLTANLTDTPPFHMEPRQQAINIWSDYPMICKFCKVKVSDKDVLGSHCVEVHKKCFGMSCVDCGVDVECFGNFLKHVRVHRPGLRKICPYCNQVIDPASDHIKVEHTANKHPCVICGTIYHHKRNLRAHEAITDPSPLISLPKKRRRNPVPTVEDLTCDICGITLKTRYSLKCHLTQHGEKKKEYTCDRCGKMYYMKGNFVAHRLIHNENIDRSVCKICNKSFLTLGRLKRHIKTHNFELPFQCDVCKKFFSSKDRIREHVKGHMNIMPFKCNFCEKKFKFISILRSHENQHTGARPYKCEFCYMDFANWSNCNKHMKRKHNASLAKHVMTRHGKLAVDPKTGKPKELHMDHDIKEWTEKVLMKKKPKREKSKNKLVTRTA